MDGSVSQVVERGSRQLVSDQGQVARTQPTRVFCLPADMRRNADSLLNQQFWLWGQDIRRREDNALLRYGFTRTRPPENTQGSNCYVLQLADHRMVALWGFGFFYGERIRGGIYVPRSHLSPLVAPDWEPPANIWQPVDVPPYKPPEDRDDWSRAMPLLVGALQWISAYETEILRESGAAYRQACLDDWSRAVCSASDVAGRWLHLAQQCEETLLRSALSSR